MLTRNETIVVLILGLIGATLFSLKGYLGLQAKGSPERQPAEIYYPMNRYNERKTERVFGEPVRPSDSSKYLCGQGYVGYHTADDLEILPREEYWSVPIFSIAMGEVIAVQQAEGYGGLIILKHEISNRTLYSYYGHVDIEKTPVTIGMEVSGDVKIGELAPACSIDNGFERKHLHFGLREFPVDLRGYVMNPSELKKWLDPAKFLEDKEAQNPT